MRIDRRKSGWMLYREDIGGKCGVNEDMVSDNEGWRREARVAGVG